MPSENETDVAERMSPRVLADLCTKTQEDTLDVIRRMGALTDNGVEQMLIAYSSVSVALSALIGMHREFTRLHSEVAVPDVEHYAENLVSFLASIENQFHKRTGG